MTKLENSRSQKSQEKKESTKVSMSSRGSGNPGGPVLGLPHLGRERDLGRGEEKSGVWARDFHLRAENPKDSNICD